MKKKPYEGPSTPGMSANFAEASHAMLPEKKAVRISKKNRQAMKLLDPTVSPETQECIARDMLGVEANRLKAEIKEERESLRRELADVRELVNAIKAIKALLK